MNYRHLSVPKDLERLFVNDAILYGVWQKCQYEGMDQWQAMIEVIKAMTEAYRNMCDLYSSLNAQSVVVNYEPEWYGSTMETPNTSDPTPNIRTVPTTKTTGNVSLRYVPRRS